MYQAEYAHWCLVVANVANKQLTFYDSLNGENSNCLQVLGCYLDRLNGGQFSRSQNKNIPMQKTRMIVEYSHACMLAV